MSNWKWVVVAGLLIAGLGGCSPDPAIRAEAVRPPVVAVGAIVLAGAHLAPSHPYNVGVRTFWSPQLVGGVRSDPAGNVAPTRVEYSCAQVIGTPVRVGFYRDDGLGIVQTLVDQSCGAPIQSAPPVAHP